MVLGPSHGCGGRGAVALDASSFESKLRAEALLFEEMFNDRIINPYVRQLAEQFDTEMRKLK